MLFFYVLFNFANRSSKFFSPNFLKLTVAFASFPFPSILTTWPKPNFSWLTLSPEEIFIFTFESKEGFLDNLFKLGLEL